MALACEGVGVADEVGAELEGGASDEEGATDGVLEGGAELLLEDELSWVLLVEGSFHSVEDVGGGVHLGSSDVVGGVHFGVLEVVGVQAGVVGSGVLVVLGGSGFLGPLSPPSLNHQLP
jgi:hypothetical protein